MDTSVLGEINILTANRKPDPALMQLLTWGEFGTILLCCCLFLYLGLIVYFIRQLKQQNPTLWESAGYPTLLKNNRGLLALLFGRLAKELPHNLQRTAKILRYLSYLIVLVLVLLSMVFYFIISIG